MKMDIKALLFDTYGTVVDWRTSVLDELRALGQRRGVTADWERFLHDWKSVYRPGMDRVNRGEWPWTTVEAIYRRGLDELLLPTYGLAGLPPVEVDELVRAWWRLRPWPDAVAGLTRLKTSYIISPLSNASFVGMIRLAKYAALPWDCVITAENARCYKPRPEVYRTAIALLGLRPDQILMVAAHNYDLAAARAEGMLTAFVPRPEEYGPTQMTDLSPEKDWELVARDFVDLARSLGC
jgi:2-haloacid dehalogenase